MMVNMMTQEYFDSSSFEGESFALSKDDDDDQHFKRRRRILCFVSTEDSILFVNKRRSTQDHDEDDLEKWREMTFGSVPLLIPNSSASKNCSSSSSILKVHKKSTMQKNNNQVYIISLLFPFDFSAKSSTPSKRSSLSSSFPCKRTTIGLTLVVKTSEEKVFCWQRVNCLLQSLRSKIEVGLRERSLFLIGQSVTHFCERRHAFFLTTTNLLTNHNHELTSKTLKSVLTSSFDFVCNFVSAVLSSFHSKKRHVLLVTKDEQQWQLMHQLLLLAAKVLLKMKRHDNNKSFLPQNEDLYEEKQQLFKEQLKEQLKNIVVLLPAKEDCPSCSRFLFPPTTPFSAKRSTKRSSSEEDSSLGYFSSFSSSGSSASNNDEPIITVVPKEEAPSSSSSLNSRLFLREYQELRFKVNRQKNDDEDDPFTVKTPPSFDHHNHHHLLGQKDHQENNKTSEDESTTKVIIEAKQSERMPGFLELLLPPNNTSFQVDDDYSETEEEVNLLAGNDVLETHFRVQGIIGQKERQISDLIHDLRDSCSCASFASEEDDDDHLSSHSFCTEDYVIGDLDSHSFSSTSNEESFPLVRDSLLLFLRLTSSKEEAAAFIPKEVVSIFDKFLKNSFYHVLLLFF